MGPRGYENCMRRSVQTVVLYEAHRCIADRLSSLRPFQRKLAFWDQAMALVDAIDLLPHQKDEIMWRTGTSKEPMQPETAWKRMKLIEKEIEKIQEKIRPLVSEERTHKETCDLYVQQQYVSYLCSMVICFELFIHANSTPGSCFRAEGQASST